MGTQSPIECVSFKRAIYPGSSIPDAQMARLGKSSELFLLKPFPPEGPEFKSEAFATNNRASVRGCGWHCSKASWDFEQLLMQIEGKRLIPGANVVTQKWSLWQ